MTLKEKIEAIVNDATLLESTRVAQIKKLVAPALKDIVLHPILTTAVSFSVGLLIGRFA